MIRKQVYLKLHHDVLLKKRAKVLGVTEAELVRRALEDFLGSEDSFKKDLKAWETEKEFITNRMKLASKPQERNWKREDLYDR